MFDYYKRQLDKINAVDVDKIREKFQLEGDNSAVYPKLCGALQFWLGEAIELAGELHTKAERMNRRLHAMRLAAETVLNDREISTYNNGDVYELLYSATDVVEKAIKDGMTDDQLRERLAEGIKDDEIEAGYLIDELRCGDCDEVHDLDEAGLCEICAEILADH